MASISITMPSLNQADFIGRTLDSIAAQTVRPLEIFIYDAGSTDGSLEYLEAFARINDHVVLEVGKDTSQSNAINQGFARSRGDILCWLNTDDLYSDPDVLAAVKDRFEAEPDLDIIYGRGQFVDASGAVIKDVFIDQDPERMQRRMVHSVAIPQPALFMRRRVFEAVGPLNESLHYCMDYEYWIRASKLGFKFGFLDRVLCHATLHAGSKTIGNRLVSLHETVRMVAGQFGFVPIQWLNLLVGAELDGANGITTGSAGKSEQHQSMLRQHFRAFNTSWQAINAIDTFPWPNEIESTRTMLADEIASGERFVTLALQPQSYAAGLSLLKQLAEVGSGKCSLLVQCVGLSREQLSEVSAIAGAWVFGDANAPANGHAEVHDPGHERSLALVRSACRAPAGSSVLWLDGRVDCTDRLECLFAAIEQDDILVVAIDSASGPQPVLAGCTDACAFALNASNSELLAPQHDVTAFGFKVGGRFQELVDDCHSIHTSTQWANALADRQEPLLADTNCKSGGESVTVGVGFTALRGISGYKGKSQTDPVLSILLHRYAAPVSPAAKGTGGDSSAAVARQANVDLPAAPMEVTGVLLSIRHRFARLGRGARVALTTTLAAASLIALFTHQITGQPLAASAVAILVLFASASAFFLRRLSQYVQRLMAENVELQRRLDSLELDARRDRIRVEGGLAETVERDRDQQIRVETIVQQASARDAALRADAQRAKIRADELESGLAGLVRAVDELRNEHAVTGQIAVQGLGRTQVLSSDVEELRHITSAEIESLQVRASGIEARMLLLQEADRLVANIAARVGEVEGKYCALSSSADELRSFLERGREHQAEADQLAVQALGRTQALAADIERLNSEVDRFDNAVMAIEKASTRMQLVLAENATDLDRRFSAAARDADSMSARIAAQMDVVRENGLWDRASLLSAWERIQALAETVLNLEGEASAAKDARPQVEDLSSRLDEVAAQAHSAMRAEVERLQDAWSLVAALATQAANDAVATRTSLDVSEARLASVANDSDRQAALLRDAVASLSARLASLEDNAPPKVRTLFQEPARTAGSVPVNSGPATPGTHAADAAPDAADATEVTARERNRPAP